LFTVACRFLAAQSAGPVREEENMDEIDLAAERAAAFLEVSLLTALKRPVAPPSTGVCRNCGVDIEALRLKMTPHTRLCSDCACEEEFRARKAMRCGVD
jgi:RNA polymerase-binding transcription factor DksA